jgi:hypothetical protein
MMLPLKECPLCKHPLAVRHPVPYSSDRTVRYICDTHVLGGRLSHYYIEVNGGHWVQIVHLPPYCILNRSDSETTDIYPFEGVGTGKITDRKLILSIPRILLTTTEKLTERLKVLVLFS